MAPHTKLPHKRTLIAGSLAIILEWFDFSIFGFYAVILSKLFFPFASETTSILSTFLIFALSFLIRPLGSVMVSSLGDRFGRKNAFLLTLVLMTLPTVFIGLLPTYADIGIAATSLLIVLRFAQALSVGGERSATISLFAEIAPPNLRGFYGSMSLFSTTTGILLASAVCGLVSSSMSREALMSYGWRIPFLLGLVTGIAAIFLRKIVQESDKFKELQTKDQITQSPLGESIRVHWRPILTVLGATVMFAVSFYLIFVYIITFGTRYGGMELSKILNLNTTILAITTMFIPLGGYISDRMGRKPSLIIGCAGEILVGLFIFNVFSGDSLTLKIVVQLAGGLFMVVFAGAFAPFMAESFPTRVRMSGISMGNVIGFSVFGGSAPLVASYLISSTGNINAPGIYLSLAAVISLLSVIGAKETYKQELR